MKTGVLQNFRGSRALILHLADGNRATLSGALSRLGLQVWESDGPDLPGNGAFDVVFFDSDRPQEAALNALPEPGPALVALIGLEAPSRLIGVVRRRCAGYLAKPVRASGVYTALVVALNEHALRRREMEERAALAERLAGRRFVTKAILRIMAEEGVDDDEAFRRLRRESMRRRIAVEALARERLGAPATEDGERREDGGRARL